MRSALSYTRAMLAEPKLAPTDWSSVIPAIASALNSTGHERLGHRADGVARTPLQVMTGIRPERPILQIIPSSQNPLDAKTLPLGRAVQVMKIDELQRSLYVPHKEVTISTQTRRNNTIAANNKTANIVAPSFSVGDFVLVRRATDRGQKLLFRWCGPRQITVVYNPLMYSVTLLRGSNCESLDCVRLIRYKDSFLRALVPRAIIELAVHTKARYEVDESIPDFDENNEDLFLRVLWDCVPDTRDWKWHPF